MKLKSLLCLVIAMTLFACSKDDEPGNGSSNNKSEVTVNTNGTTSTGAIFSAIDETTFYLDYVKYKIVDSHLEIIGYDPIEIGANVKPYATVIINGTAYNTRVIGKDAFGSCKQLETISIPSTVIDIEASFIWCENLKEISIPESITKINESTFYGCTSLCQVSLPNTITSIGIYAFASCKSLREITIPNSVVIIGGYAFSGCDALVDIYIGGCPKADTYYYQTTFSNYNATLHVTKENYEWAKTTEPWCEFSKIIDDYTPKK